MMTPRPTRSFVRARPFAFAAASAVVVAATYLGSALGPHPASQAAARPGTSIAIPAPAAQAAPATATQARVAALDHEIGLWTASLAANDADYIAATRLGQLALERARVTADLDDYRRALTAADHAVRADPIYWPGHALRASALFALHDFTGALDEARATYEADGSQLDALAVVGDASLELGDLVAAEDAYARLAELALSPPVWSRMARLAFIQNRPNEALELVERCIAATNAAADPTGAAFYSYQLGELHRSAGRTEEAAAALERSLEAVDGYVPALAALAHVREAQGRRADAIRLLEEATSVIPQPELVAALGDLYALSGDDERGEQQYALVERIGRVEEAAGGVYDRQLVLFAADHDLDPRAAVAAAEASLETRRDVHGHDAHAWALYAAGRIDQAAEAAARALALGTPDPRLAYHAGIIALADGRAADARALLATAVAGRAALPPLQAERAADALDGLEP
jgi:tetratricopeptide (TPR) repeat protein